MGRRRDDGVGAAEKVCAACGRVIEWRRKWARDWDAVRWCGAACRRRGIGGLDRRLETAIGELLDSRPRDGSICPSEAARRVDPDGWRELREPARRAARRLVEAGEVQIVQGGQVVDPSTARGPIRLRRPR